MLRRNVQRSDMKKSIRYMRARLTDKWFRKPESEIDEAAH